MKEGLAFSWEPMFFTDSFFVEKPERVETILFLISLCLMVYHLDQRELRQSLNRSHTAVKNQVGKLTDHPTSLMDISMFSRDSLTENESNSTLLSTSQMNGVIF